MSTDSVTTLRLQLLANGFTPIRNRDKRTFLKGWPDLEVTEEVIRQWARQHDLGTGIRLDGDLAVIDFDVNDRDMMVEIANAIFDAIPELADPSTPLLQRMGKGYKEAWFVRCAESFSRIHGKSWLRPGETPDDGAHRVEMFGGARPRQFGAFGPHTVAADGSVQVEYRWLERSPADTRQSELPLLAKAQLFLIGDIADAIMEKHGWKAVEMSTSGENDVQRLYDLTDDMQFDIDTGERLSLRELRERAAAVESLRCSASWIEGPHAKRTDRCIVTLTHDGHVAVWESASGVTHVEAEAAPRDKPAAVTADLTALGQKMLARGMVPAAPEVKAEAEALVGDPRELHRISVHDDAATAAGKLLQLYAFCPTHPRIQVLPIYANSPEDGMTLASLKLLHAANNEERTGVRGGVTTVSPAGIWVAHEDRVTVGGIRMRPDMPWPLYEEGGERWINCYRKPVHDAEPEGEEAFEAFMEHLLPAADEREWQLDWLAHKWVHPEVPGPGVIHVAREQGAGRGTFFSMVMALFGEKYVRKVDGATLTGEGSQGQYNRFLGGSLVVTVDEILSSDGEAPWKRRSTYERLKLLVDPAARVVQIVQKTLNNYDAWVYASMLMATNHDNALPLDEDDRRFGVLTNGGPMQAALLAMLEPFRKGSRWSPGFLAMLSAKLERRAAERPFNPYAAPPSFKGKLNMIRLNSTDVQEVADQAIEEMPGDFVTRNDFLDRVRLMMGDAARDHKNLIGEALGRLNRKWYSMGREKIRENGTKAPVWARNKELADRVWRGSPLSQRGHLIDPCSDPKAKKTAAEIEALALKLRVVTSERSGGQ